MANNDVELIWEQLKDQYTLSLTNTFSLNMGFNVDLKVLCGESVLGRFYLYKEDDFDELVFTVEFAKPRKPRWYLPAEKYTHWHPHSREQAQKDVIAFMDGSHKFLL